MEAKHDVAGEEKDLPGLYDLPHPCDNADWLSYLIFTWPTPLIELGGSRTISLEDLPPVSKHDDANMLNEKLKRYWNYEYKTKGKNATLYMPLARAYWEKHWFSGLFLLSESAVKIYQAQVFGQLIRWFLGETNSSNSLMNNGYFLSFIIVLGGIAVTLFHHHAFFHGWRLGLQLRMSLSTMIFDKAANLSLRSLSKVSLGHVVNLSSQDIEGFQLMGCFLHFMYQPVVESLAVLYLGIMEIGLSFIAGFAIILLLIPLQKVFSKKLATARRLTSKNTDWRIKLINQALAGARLMKINGWETVFGDLIETARRSEVGTLLVSSTMRGLNEAIFFAAPVIIASITFSTYSALGYELSTAKIFIVLSYYNIVQMSMTKFFALAVMAASESSVALGRIANFLKLEDDHEVTDQVGFVGVGANANEGELMPGAENTADDEGVALMEVGATKSAAVPDPSLGVKVSGITAAWYNKNGASDTNKSDKTQAMESLQNTTATEERVESDVLRNISLEVLPGELAVIVGPVGCSKTSLLMAIMGELKTKKGQITVRGLSLEDISKGSDFSGNKAVDAAAIAGGATTSALGRTGKVPDGTSTFAYAAQEPWIMSNTLRNNILFGLAYDQEWYDQVISACSLNQDLLELPNGDATIIGDKGVNLSGGQKARVGLARALYTKAHVLLLDDPLSAVDSHVGHHLFHHAVCCSKLFQAQGSDKKTVILVTHQVQFLNSEAISKIIVMDSGAVTVQGSYEELVQSGKLEFVGGHGSANNEESHSRTVSMDSPTQPTIQNSKLSQTASLNNSNTNNSINEGNKGVMRATIGRDSIGRESIGRESEVDNFGLRGVSTADLVELVQREAEKDGDEESIPEVEVGSSEFKEGGTLSTGEIVIATKIDDNIQKDKSSSKKGLGSDIQDKSSSKKGQGPISPVSLIVPEDKAAGEVHWDTFSAYGKALGGPLICVGLGVIMCIPQILAIMCNYWLALWSRKDKSQQHAGYWMNTYIILVVTCVFASILRAVVFFKSAVFASQNLHNKMLRSVLRAPIHFFDSNPIGRILNRFSKDTTLIDDMLPYTVYDFIQCTLMVIAAILVVCSGTPFIFLALLPLIWYFYSLRKYFLKTSRELKRIEALSRSPVFSHLSETLDGLVTIRALNRKQVFLDMHKVLVNDNCRAYFSFIAASRWLGFRLDVIVTVLLLVSTFGAVACKESNLPIDPNLLAVGIMYVIQLAGLFQWCVRQSAELESQMVSVERVLGFTRLPSEAALHGPANVGEENLPCPVVKAIEVDDSVNTIEKNEGTPLECAGVVVTRPNPADISDHRPQWPEHGGIVAYRFSASYREDLPPVLSDVSFTIRPGSRVGVVGRTGAGKSTLVSAFLRLVNATSGAIYIDGMDISQIGLHDLRPRISVIPQTPFLFSGTVRQNLDPWNKYSDTEVWNALRASGLQDVVNEKSLNNSRVRPVAKSSKSPADKNSDDGVTADNSNDQNESLIRVNSDGLLCAVEEGGLNFSTGERQLLCLARAILQRNKLLVMDEATANIDLDTDSKVQSAIYEEFTRKGTTVITIAHRLHTIIENDQILVLAKGKLVENGHPHDLLCKYFGEPSKSSSIAEGNVGSVDEMDSVKGIRPPKHSLASLVKQTGAEMCLKLRRLAHAAHDQYQQQQQQQQQQEQ